MHRAVARTDDKRRGRLNIIRHLLSRIPYEALPREKVVLPKRQKQGDYEPMAHGIKYVDEYY